MEDEAKELLTRSGEKLLEYMEATEGFVAEQAPLLAQEIVRFGVWYHGVMTIVAVVATLALGKYVSIAGKKAWSLAKDDDDLIIIFAPFVVLPTVIMLVAFFITTLAHIQPFLEALLAPRLYILHEIGKLI